jgi:hypothetical protein
MILETFMCRLSVWHAYASFYYLHRCGVLPLVVSLFSLHGGS